MKYKIKAYHYSEDDWEPQYIKPVIPVGDVIMTGDPVRLNKHFKTEKEANNYTINYLREQSIDNYEIIENED